MNAAELVDSPEGTRVEVGHKTYTKTWSGAWQFGGQFLSSDELARTIKAVAK